MAVETIHVLGEGGSVIEMDLPLPEGIAQRYDAGLIVRVHPDGSPWTETPDQAPGTPGASGSKPAARKTQQRGEARG